MNFKRSIPFLFLFALIMLSQTSFAQCAMCKTSVESDLNSGGSIGKGLNTGILYLMSIPYVLLMVGGYFAFRKTIDAKIKAWKDKRFPKKQVQ